MKRYEGWADIGPEGSENPSTRRVEIRDVDADRWLGKIPGPGGELIEGRLTVRLLDDDEFGRTARAKMLHRRPAPGFELVGDAFGPPEVTG